MDILKILRERRQRLGELANQRRQKRQARARIIIKSRIDEVLDPRSAKGCRHIGAATSFLFRLTEKTRILSSAVVDPMLHLRHRNDDVVRWSFLGRLLSEFMMGSMGTAVGEAVTVARNTLPAIICH